MATDFLVKQGKVMGGVRLVTDADVAHQTDLTNIRETGTTASQAISAGTYFYLNDVLVRAKVDIANGATFTLNTNYEVVTAGALNELNAKIYSPAPKGTPIEVATGTNITQNYTPTVDGFATITALSNGSDCFVYIYNTTKDYGFSADASIVGRTIRIYLPVNAGETITYRIGGTASSGVAQYIPMK